MSSLQLDFLAKSDKGGLYQYQFTDAATKQKYSLYFLLATVPPDSTSIVLEKAWNNLPGAFLFLPLDATIANMQNFIDAVLSAVGSFAGNDKLIGWVNDPTNVQQSLASGQNMVSAKFQNNRDENNNNKYTSTSTANVLFENIALTIPAGAILSLQDDDTSGALAFNIIKDSGQEQGNFFLRWNLPGHNSNTVSIEDNVSLNIPVDKNHMGCIQFLIRSDRGSFYNLFINKASLGAAPSAEIQYSFGTEGSVKSIRYPIFLGIKSSQHLNLKLQLEASLDPLSPTDGRRSYFHLVDVPGNDPLACNFFVDTLGNNITLQPVTSGGGGGGFGLGIRPFDTDTSNKVLYLTPNGRFQVVPADPSNPKKMQVLCGISGTEFLLIAEGDNLEFINSTTGAGYAPNYPLVTNRAVDQLDNSTTTSWIKVIPDETNQKIVFGTSPVFKESYCVQSLGAIFFKELEGRFFSTAIGCRMADLAVQTQNPFLLAPYLSVYAENSNDGFKSANPDIPAQTIEDFEMQVISTNRQRQMQPDACFGPLFFDLNTNIPLNGGFVRTPNGMLVKLNDSTSPVTSPAGTWNRLLLAKSPVNDNQFLSIGLTDVVCAGGNQGAQVVNPELSNAIMGNSPFIVITKDTLGKHDQTPSFKNELQMGEFTFLIDLGINKPETPDKTIIIFKLGKGQSVLDLSQATTRWANTDFFVGSADNVTNLSTYIATFINNAKPAVGDTSSVFADFFNKMTDVNWTGMISLNCSLDYKALPIDLQMLLGGIDGQLMAHHFGVSINHIDAKDVSTINDSSLFGLVHYDKDLQKNPTPASNNFQVLKLNALFKNSALAHFDSRIAMTVPKLYEENTKLTVGSSSHENVIEIDGVYQKPKDPTQKVGKIVFNTDKIFVFDFNPNNTNPFRALDKMVVTGASYLPVQSINNTDGSINIIANFSLNGGLGFTPTIGTDPNNANQQGSLNQVDLFSFQIDADYKTNKGIAVSNYNLQITTNINGNTAGLTGGIPTRYDEVTMAVQQTQQSDQSRPGSFYDTFPLKFINFMFNTGIGLTAASVKGRQMIMDELESTNKFSGPLKNVGPHFALHFKINVGSLGGLVSDKSILEAEIIAGWTIAGDDNTANQIGMIFLPPKGISADGSFKIQGVFNSFYNDIMLDRYPVNAAGDTFGFVITLKDVNFYILSLALVPSNWERSLTFFGAPDKPKENNLTWCVGDPSHADNPTPDPDPIDVGFSSTFPGMGLMSGLDIKSDPTTIDVIGSTIDELFNVNISTKDFIKNLATARESDGIVEYNPNAGILFWLDFEFLALSVKLLFDDPSFYGGMIKIQAPDKKKQKKEGEEGGGAALAAVNEEGGGEGGEGEGKSLKDKWGGLELIFVYRKINDNLGEYAAQFTLPESLSNFNLGEVEITLPSFGLEYFTNGDYKVTVGWPFSSTTSGGTQQLKLIVIVLGIPVEFTAGFYLAKLRSADSPAEFGTQFNLIWMFGIGLGGGIGFDEELGPISISASVLLWVTFEAMLGSKSGDINQNGVDYYWFAGQVGITARVSGELNLWIISASLEFEFTVAITIAVETGHRTEIQVVVQVKVELSVHIIFFTISFHFKLQITLGTFDFGPEKCVDGSPSQPALVSAPTVTVACGFKEAAHPAHIEFEEAEATFFDHNGVELEAATVITNLNLYFAVQPTAVSDSPTGPFNPFAVLSLFIETGATPSDPNDFATMTKAIGSWMFNEYKGTATDFVGQLNSVISQSDTFEEVDVIRALGELFIFTINTRPNDPANPKAMAVFPMIEGLSAAYDGSAAPVDFDANQAGSDYLALIENYFNQLSQSESKNSMFAFASGNKASITQYVLQNYFGLIAKSLFKSILSLATAKGSTITSMNLAYAQLTTQDNADGSGFNNISGMVSRYMLHGLQLPDPNEPSVLKPLYSLTSQLVELTANGTGFFKKFTLNKTASAPAWVNLTTDPVTDDMDPGLILKPETNFASWTKNAKQLDPLASFTRAFHFSHSMNWTGSSAVTSNIRLIPNSLVQLVTNEPAMLTNIMIAKQLPDNAGQVVDISSTNIPVVNNTPALFITLKLKQIPDPAQAGQFLADVFLVEGTDEDTREQLQAMLDDSSSVITSIDLLSSSGKGTYSSPANQNNALLVRTNLSTESAPEGTAFADFVEADALSADSTLGPLQARLNVTEAKDFLRLIWEVSIVHTKGFFLMIEGLDTSLFKNQEAPVAILVQLKAANPAKYVLKPYYNMLVLDNSMTGKAVASYLEDNNENTLQTYSPNYQAGFTGFTINTQTLAVPSVTSPDDYLQSIYHFIQYRINSISGDPDFKETNWSQPLGAQSESDPADSTKLDWTFRQSIPVPKITNATNRYSAVGQTVALTARVLDMYGDAHPDTWTQNLVVKYNDPLLVPAQWQGILFSYKVLAVSGQVQLQITFSYQDGGIKDQSGNGNNKANLLKDTIEKYGVIFDQLTDPNVSVSIVTTLAALPLTQGTDNIDFGKKLADYVNTILVYLNTVSAPLPNNIVLTAALDTGFVSGLPNDIIELDVTVTIARDSGKVDPAISILFADVLSASVHIPPYVASGNDPSKPQSGLVPFASSFESAYAGFAGAGTALKIAQGPQKAVTTGTAIRQVYAVRWGVGAGIHVEAPNSGASPGSTDKPDYFAPAPLSTVLLSKSFINLIDYTNGLPTNTNVTKAFNNIDLDQWALYFLNSFHDLMSPEVSTAIAQLDELDSSGSSKNYQNLIAIKESLADNITSQVTNVINFNGVTPDPTEARAKFRQALLATLTEDYNTSVIIQLPANVSVKGQTPKHAPRLYGKISDNIADIGNSKIYTLSNGSLDAANETEQFAFLAASKRPETDAFLNFANLNFDIGFIEYKFEDNETQFGFTPSSWLTIVIPNDPSLQISLGKINAPIPLRSYPPAPVLSSQIQVISSVPSVNLQDSLNWNYKLTISNLSAEQDELNLTLSFNEPIDKTENSLVAEALFAGRPVPADLFEALARFIYEYPQLQPALPAVISAAKSSSDGPAQQAARSTLALITGLANDISTTWATWKNPGISAVNDHLMMLANVGDSIFSWQFSIINLISKNQLILTQPDGQNAIWPDIAGYTKGDPQNNTTTYTATITNGSTLELTFAGLFILTHQSVNAAAYVVRNEDLGMNGGNTNLAFVYTTESVKFPSALVPLVENNNAIKFPMNGSNLSDTMTRMFNTFFTDPANSQISVDELKFSLGVETKFTLANNADLSQIVSARTPVLFSSQTVSNPSAGAGTDPDAIKLADFINDLAPFLNSLPEKQQKELFLVMTIFANITTGQLPLVLYSEIDLQ